MFRLKIDSFEFNHNIAMQASVVEKLAIGQQAVGLFFRDAHQEIGNLIL